VIQWVEANFPAPMIVRTVGYRVREGWLMKCVFKRQEDAEAFHRYWYPDETDHSVPRWRHSLPKGDGKEDP